MAKDFQSLYRARTGSVWTSGAINLAPDGNAASIEQYLVTGLALDNTWFDINSTGTNVSANVVLLDCVRQSELIGRVYDIYAGEVNISTDVYNNGTGEYWMFLDVQSTLADGGDYVYISYADGGFNGTFADQAIWVDYIYCFVAGTKVSTPSGDIPIEMLKAGDRVFSLNEKTGLVVPTTIKKVLHHKKRPLTMLKINNRIVTTQHHPLLSNGVWTKAKDLKLGDVLTGADNKPIPITEIVPVKTNEPVYNIEILDEHKNYLANGIVSHNKCPFLYGVNEDGTEELINTFIYKQNSIDKDWVQRRATESKKLYKSYVIRELDDETSFIEFLSLLVTDKNGRTYILRCKDKRLREIDGQYVCTETGDSIPVEFTKYFGDEIVTIDILAKGYYISNS